MCNLSAVIHTSLGVMYVLHDDKYTGSILELGTLTGSLGSSVVCKIEERFSCSSRLLADFYLQFS